VTLESGSILCLDAAYGPTSSSVAGALIDDWDAAEATQMIVRRFDGPPEEYEPGAFYKRELPLLLPIISEVADRVGVIVIDGYVWLGTDDQPGLGAHLFERLGSLIPVIGVAKTPYRDDTWSVPVPRGESKRPLLVTSAGIDKQDAATCIRRMHGDHRIPTILALVDRAARDGLA
jgi:deoxyribonuclease V